MSYKVNHIINYILLFSLLSTIFGKIYFDYKINIFEKQLIKIENTIEIKINDEEVDINFIEY
jgi:hypothetical protein